MSLELTGKALASSVFDAATYVWRGSTNDLGEAWRIAYRGEPMPAKALATIPLSAWFVATMAPKLWALAQNGKSNGQQHKGYACFYPGRRIVLYYRDRSEIRRLPGGQGVTLFELAFGSVEQRLCEFLGLPSLK